jgi:hypothetical protein
MIRRSRCMVHRSPRMVHRSCSMIRRNRRMIRSGSVAHVCRIRTRPVHRSRMRDTCHRPGHCRRSRPAMIHRSQCGTVMRRKALMLRLFLRRRYMVLVHRHLLLRRRPCLHTSGTAIVTDSVDGGIVDHRPVYICIVDNGRIHIRHGRIIPETTASPIAAAITGTAITKTIIYTAIEPDMRAPITAMPAIKTA